MLKPQARREAALDVKAADRVPFGKWAGTEVLIDGETRLILKKSDILGLIESKSRATVRAA
jgi:chaperonin GroES